MEGTSENAIQASMPASPPDSPVLPSSEPSGRQLPRKGKGNDTGEDGPVTTRQPKSKGRVLFFGEPAMELDELSIEELSDFEENDMDGRDDVLAPHVIEYAESDQSESHIEGHIINDLRDLNFRSPDPDSMTNSSNSSDDEYQEVIQRLRAVKQRKRRIIASLGKRTMSERSDSDSGSFQHKLHPDQAGSSARRLSRRIGIRQNLMFQDPTLRPDKMDEPPEELEDTEMLGKALPFYAFTAMEVDSPGTSTLDVSHVAPSSLQGAGGNESASDEKDSFPTSSIFGLELEIPQKSGENATIADDDEDTRSDRESCADETISVQSYADSVFDAGSVGSSSSSVYSDTQALVGEYVGFLVRDPGLEKLFTRSMLPTVLGPERFRRNYSRILQSYARDLKRQLSMWNEPKMPLRTQGLAFISRRSITMKTASIIASRYMEKAPRSPFHPGRTEGGNAEILGGDETSSGEESPANESVHTFVISELGQYFREGAPFQRMKRNLRNLVIPRTLLSRVKASTERIMDLIIGDDYLRFLLFKALSDPLVPVRDHLRVAEFIETYAGYIGTRAAQKMEGMDMEAILQGSQFNTHNGYKIIIEDNKSQSQLPINTERQVELQSFEEQSLGSDVVPLVIGDLADQLDQHPIARLIAIFMLVYLFEEDLNTMTATLLWCCSTASEERRETGTEGLRYFTHTWSIGDGDDLEQKFHCHIWKPYRKCLSSTSEEVLETIIDDNLPNLCDADIDSHWPFVASSKIFKEYVDRVRDVAIPTFFPQAKRLIAEGLVGDEDPDAEAGKINLLRALAELQWCFMQTGVAPTLHISTSEPSLKSFRVSNLVKLAVEGSSQSTWQWWPLQPPNSRGKARHTDCRISWKCLTVLQNCGTEREEIVPFVYASKLSHLASQFPLSNEPPERPPSSLSSDSSQATKATSGSESQSTSSGSSSAAGSSSLRSSTAATSPSSSVISFGTPPKAFVFLVVKASRYILAPIDVTEKKARDFFQAIVENYNVKRGWRRLLSIYVYSHCDFVKIKRYAPQSFDPGVRFSFPPHDESPHDKEYGYYPRPMPHAPVSRHMFNHLFNACYSDAGLARRLHFAFIAPSCIIRGIPGKLLDGMPKRDRLVDEQAEFGEDQDVEVFWGLVAREQRSALRVAVYMLLGLGPSLWFMFQWLFGWGHDGDLQDATVPLMFSATMLGILCAVVYSGDEVREVEQPR
ncbi:hypothetical protein INS49_013948 [Diaporthe citri]|uniref:uncharacterized protein n=1 Tax=Diaporthe citri TaxID=83186 RepID=UPI001C804B7B|nr:uncharacterized protein INS49_013948 [Diaporthe citri]KAG6358064.1 hypothetical protein INS49_013948 [Diaporthe citri]